MFKIGEKVVALKTFRFDSHEFENGVRHPVKNEIYIIRTIEFQEGEVCLRFEEIINPELGYENGNDWGEVHYVAYEFRKLDYQFAENLLEKIMKEVVEEHFYELQPS